MNINLNRYLFSPIIIKYFKVKTVLEMVSPAVYVLYVATLVLGLLFTVIKTVSPFIPFS